MDYKALIRETRKVYNDNTKPHRDAIDRLYQDYKASVREIMIQHTLLNPIVRLLADGHTVTLENEWGESYFRIDFEYPLAVYGNSDDLQTALMEANDFDLVEPRDDENPIDTYELTDYGRQQYENWKIKQPVRF